jgi:hypothetical protein
MSIPKIRIGLPCYKQRLITRACLESVSTLQRTEGFNVELVKAEGTDIGHLRNIAINGNGSNKKYQTFDFDYYLSLDSDIGFTPRHLRRLLDLDRDIVACPYEMRKDNTEHFVGGYWGQWAGFSPHENWLSVQDRGLRKVDWIGAGFVLIKSKVLETMIYPWYRHMDIDMGDEFEETSEDLGFCLWASKFGYETWVDCDHPVKHIQG